MIAQPLLHRGVVVGCLLFATGMVRAQDSSPLKAYHVWLPMTGATPEQVDEAAAAGFDAAMFKIHPPLASDGRTLASDKPNAAMERARQRGMKMILAILGWTGLDRERFCDVDEAGTKIPGRLDPFDPQAMEQYERYIGLVIDRYRDDTSVVAFAPTWGIYGEAGFVSQTAGRSPHALARFNEWLAGQHLPTVEQLPDRRNGPNTAYNRFIRFRYLYLEQHFDEMYRRLKPRTNGRPLGAWQELYSVMGYLWNMVRVPSADFSLYESCFPFQTNHDVQHTLAETMGFRYRCASAAEYRNYELPLLARKRGEGQRFMGCQLTSDYAVRQYGWSAEKAQQVAFDRWEDEFSPTLKKLMAEPLESPARDVLLVFPTYAAATLTDRLAHAADATLIDVILRQFGCQMTRVGSPQFDQLTVEQLNAYKLIVVPAAAYLLTSTLDRLAATRATVLFTGEWGQALDGEYVTFDDARAVQKQRLQYLVRPAGRLAVLGNHVLTQDLAKMLQATTVDLPEDETFVFDGSHTNIETLLTCGERAVLSCWPQRRWVFLHGQFFAGLCYDPQRKPPTGIRGSRDGSADDTDMWGPYSSSHANNAFGLAVMRNVLDFAGVDYRVCEPLPRVCAPLLGDNMEAAGCSANMVYNNTAVEQTLKLHLPYAPAGIACEGRDGKFMAAVQIPPFGYVALQKTGGQ